MGVLCFSGVYTILENITYYIPVAYRRYEVRTVAMFVVTVVLPGPFEKFVDSPYYPESEFCGGAVTVSFTKYLLSKGCSSYNAPPTSRKRATDR
jgi:hypothetical protein